MDQEVVVVVCEGVVLLDLAGPVQVLNGTDGYRVRLASLDGQAVRSDTGVVLGVDCRLSDVDHLDTVVVPGPTPELIDHFPPALIGEVRRLGSGAGPASRPASASRNAPVQIDVTRPLRGHERADLVRHGGTGPGQPSGRAAGGRLGPSGQLRGQYVIGARRYRLCVGCEGHGYSFPSRWIFAAANVRRGA